MIAFGLLNPDPAYAPTFQTTPEDRPSVLERAGEIGLAVAVGAIGVKIGQAESGPQIRNKHLAGEVHPVTGVPFDEHGFPDFRAAGVVEREVQIKYTGTRAGDYKAALLSRSPPRAAKRPTLSRKIVRGERHGGQRRPESP